MYDTVIRNARICDGSGRPIYDGSLAIKDGRIAAVGAVEGPARETVDAEGRVLAPGFIDPHTHYDAQLTWDGLATPALEHGVTTVVPGNCSLSLAPVRAKHRPLMAATFRKIEEMPKMAFDAGLKWNWESFEDYVAAVSGNLGINVAPLVGHSCLRLWVMDIDARERAATATEIAAMQVLLRQCLKAGAVGMSTSWVDIDHENRPVPSRMAMPEELDALCAVLGERNAVLQVVPEFWDADLLSTRVDILADLSLRHDITCTFSPLMESSTTPGLTAKVLDRIRLQAASGARVVPQMQTRAIDITFDLNEQSLIFAMRPQWWVFLGLPKAERIAILADPARCRPLEDDLRREANPLGLVLDIADYIVVRIGSDKNKSLIGRTLRQIAEARGGDPASTMIDLALEEDFDVSFRAQSCGHNDLAKIGKALADPLVEIGAGDGGAHVTRFSTYGDSGYLFSCFVRDRKALSLELAVHKLTQHIAQAWGLKDRGLLSPGFAADLVLFDPDVIDRTEELAVEDLPAEGYRYIRHATGIDSVFVNGRRAFSARDGYGVTDAGAFVLA